jgi:glutamate carboxypeptidase
MRERDERKGRPGADHELASRVLGWLRDEHDAIRILLERWASIETPSRAPDTQQPLFAAIARELEELGFATRLLPGRRSGGSLYARPERRQRSLGIDADGERIRGPGVYHMKARLVQIVFALRALRAQGASPALTPIVFVNSDEEIGSRESTAMIRRLARIVERTFVLEPSLGLEGRLKTARKGVGRFTIRVRGKAAHAGLDPEAGISAILELSHVVQELFALNDVGRGVSVNVGTIEGGLGANVIAPESSAVVDVRVLTQADAERIERAILGLEPTTPGAELEIEGRIGRPPMERTPGNQALFETAQRLGSEMGLEIQEATAGGGSDGNTTSLFGPTLDGLGAVGDGAHAQHEFVFAERLPERAALLALLLMAEPDRSSAAA